MSLLARPSPSQLDFMIGWICIIPDEHYAALEILDEQYVSTTIVPGQGDRTTYILGRVGEHNVVINVPATTNYGELHASVIAKNMKSTFPQIRFVLLVGIGGGIPLRHDIRLGDVVLGTQVIPYAFGKETEYGFVRTGRVAIPPECLLVALTSLEGRRKTKEIHISRSIDTISARRGSEPNDYSRPREDRLYDSQYRHDERYCDCLKPNAELISRILPRRVRDGDLVQTHKGNIGTANIVMKNAEVRDKLATQEQLVCFEMEATGVMLSVPCLPIRGISDYADGHKNDSSQPYAALAAAVCAKELLATMSRQTVLYAPLELEGPTLEKFVNGVFVGRVQNGDDLSIIRLRLEALNGRHQFVEEWLATQLTMLMDSSQDLNQVRDTVAELERLHQKLQNELARLGGEVEKKLRLNMEKDFVTRKEWEELHNQVQQHANRFEELSGVAQGALETTTNLLEDIGKKTGNGQLAWTSKWVAYAHKYAGHLAVLAKHPKTHPKTHQNTGRQVPNDEPPMSADSRKETTRIENIRRMLSGKSNSKTSTERSLLNSPGTHSTFSTISASPSRHPEHNTQRHRAKSPPSTLSTPTSGRTPTHPPVSSHPTGYSRDSVRTDITAPTETINTPDLEKVGVRCAHEDQDGMSYKPTHRRCRENRTAQPNTDHNPDDEDDPSLQSVKEKIKKFGGHASHFKPNRG